MRTPTLLFCLSLGISLTNCAGAGAAHMTATEDGGAAAFASGRSSAPSRLAANTQSAKQKSQDSSTAENDDMWKEGGVTREKINAMCWMKYEHGRKDLPLEKRADLVNQCVIDTLKEHPLR